MVKKRYIHNNLLNVDQSQKRRVIRRGSSIIVHEAVHANYVEGFYQFLLKLNVTLAISLIQAVL